MKTVFIYNAPHRLHAAWANSINADFVNDKVRFSFPLLSRFVKSLKTTLSIGRYDLAICEGGSQMITGYFMKLFNKSKNLCLIISDPKLFFIKDSKISFFYNFILSKYDILICSTDFMASFVPEKFKDKVVVVPPFYDKIFNSHKCNLSSHNIMYAGRVCRTKGADLDVIVAEKLKNEFSDTKLYLIGIDGDYSPPNNNMIVRVQPTNEVFKYYSNGSVYLSLARFEAANIAVLEAMAQGLVPVVSENVGMKGVVEKLDRMLVVSSVGEAVNVINYLWKNKKKLSMLSRKSRTLAKNFTMENSLSRFRNAIKNVL